jgi:hypothetical protein
MNRICSDSSKVLSFQTMVNYAKVVAERNKIDLKSRNLKIIIVTEPLKVFTERYNPNYKPIQQVLFESPFLNI